MAQKKSALTLQIEPTNQIEPQTMAVTDGARVYLGKVFPESGGRVRFVRKGRSYLLPATVKTCRIVKKEK